MFLPSDILTSFRLRMEESALTHVQQTYLATLDVIYTHKCGRDAGDSAFVRASHVTVLC